jgi:hypothetical protein
MEISYASLGPCISHVSYYELTFALAAASELSETRQALEQQYITDQTVNWFSRALHQPKYTQLISKCKKRVDQSMTKFQVLNRSPTGEEAMKGR